jgi:hypothetical protein
VSLSVFVSLALFFSLSLYLSLFLIKSASTNAFSTYSITHRNKQQHTQ